MSIQYTMPARPAREIATELGRRQARSLLLLLALFALLPVPATRGAALLHPRVRVLLQQLQIVISLGLEGVPLECVGAKGYLKRLQLWMILPLVVVCIGFVAESFRLSSKKRLTAVNLFKGATPNTLRIFFVTYPIVTNVALVFLLL